MNFDKFLRTLGLEEKLDVDAVTKAGTCAIALDNQITINIECDEKKGTVHSYCTVEQTPQSKQDVLFAMLLQAHMFGVATEECTFGFQVQNNQVILFNSIQIETLGNETAIKQLDCLANNTKHAAEFLHTYLSNTTTHETVPKKNQLTETLIKDDFLQIVEKLNFSYSLHTKNTAIKALTNAETAHQEARSALTSKTALHPADLDKLYLAQLRVDQAKTQAKEEAEFAAIMQSVKKLLTLDPAIISSQTPLYL